MLKEYFYGITKSYLKWLNSQERFENYSDYNMLQGINMSIKMENEEEKKRKKYKKKRLKKKEVREEQSSCMLHQRNKLKWNNLLLVSLRI